MWNFHQTSAATPTKQSNRRFATLRSAAGGGLFNGDPKRTGSRESQLGQKEYKVAGKTQPVTWPETRGKSLEKPQRPQKSLQVLRTNVWFLMSGIRALLATSGETFLSVAPLQIDIYGENVSSSFCSTFPLTFQTSKGSLKPTGWFCHSWNSLGPQTFPPS